MAKHRYNIFTRPSLQSLLMPVLKGLPFLLFSYVMIGGIDVLRRIHGEIVVPDPKVSLVKLIGDLLLAFFFAYLLTLAITAAARKWVKIIVYVVLLSLFLTVSFTEAHFNARICPQILTLIAETNKAESSEFLQVYALAPKSLVVYGWVSVLAVLIIVSEHFYGRFLSNTLTRRMCIFESSIIKKAICVLLAVVLTLSVVYGGKTYSELFKCSTSDAASTWQPLGPQDYVSDIIYSLYALNLTGKEIDTAIEVTKNAITKVSVQEGDSINLILVIGESHIKWHSSLYGYRLPTNPQMEKEKESSRLFVFQDVVATSIRTSDNIKNILSCNCIGQGEKWYAYPAFPSIFKKAGFHVSFFDNQGNGSKTSTGFALNSFLYNEDILNASYDQVSDTCFKYDGEMIDYYSKVGKRDKRNLLIFHLIGQHVKADENYPHKTQFSRFGIDDIIRNDAWLDDKKRQIIAEYDNATLYNDQVLREITKLYEEENTVMVYLSDHGEETYDYRNQYGRKLHDAMTSDYVKYIYEIPFMIWCSDKFISGHPEIITEMKEASYKPFSSDNLCQIMFYLGGVKSVYYKSNLNPLYFGYKCPRRIIEGEYIFDECRKQGN